MNKTARMIILISLMLTGCMTEYEADDSDAGISDADSVEARNICDASEISESGFIYTPIADLKAQLQDKAFQKQLKEFFSDEPSRSDPDSVLYEQNGCYFSTYGAAMYNVNTNKAENSLQCFFFTQALEEAGTISFYLNGNELISNISVNDADIGTGSAILKKLSADAHEKYVILTDGFYSMALLNRANETEQLAGGAEEFTAAGECYALLDNNNLSISYSDITDEKNLIWIGFE